MDAVKSLEAQRSGTSRGMGIGTAAWWVRELGKPSPAPVAAMFGREAMGAYKPLVKSRSAGWVAEGSVVPIEPSGQHNRR